MKKKIDNQQGFTRTDLVAIVAICVALSFVTFPLRGDAQTDGDTLVCRSNMRQLVRAMHLYSMDNGGYLPINWEDATPGRNWIVDNYFETQTQKSAALQNPATSMLANYVERSVRPFKCPADKTTVRAGGQLLARTRSVSMNLAVGTDGLVSKTPTAGAWLDGQHSHTANRTWRCFGKLSDMVRPIPSEIYVFLDEHPDSINDGLFGLVGPGLPRTQKRWIDWPAYYHNGGAGFGMADGSAVQHRWVSAPPPVNLSPQPPTLPASLPDIDWLSAHTTARITDQP